MKTRVRKSALGAIIPLLAVAWSGCSDRDPAGLPAARAPIDPLVFDDAFSADVYFQAFQGTDPYVVASDSVFVEQGTKSLKITVPPKGSNLGAYAGGVLTSGAGRDEADFNALTFYARSSIPSTLNVAGFGNDNTGTSRYEAGRSAIPLSTAWTQVVIPIPSPGRLISERGMFTFAEDQEAAHPEGHQVWFDDIRYARLPGIANPRPVMASANKQYFVGATAPMTGTATTFAVDGADVTVNHMPGYFDFLSADPAVAAVEQSAVRVVGTGSAVITATLDGTPVAGFVTVRGYQPPAAPAPRPTLPAADVISLLSDVYPNAPVDSWNPHWNYSTTEDADYSVDGDNTKMYSFLNFVGIDFSSHPVDASAMGAFHIDVYAPEGSNFLVKLVAFNASGLLIGQSELRFDAATTPAFRAGAWSSLEIPMANFHFAVPVDHLRQLVLSTSDAQLVLVDNIYWHR